MTRSIRRTATAAALAVACIGLAVPGAALSADAATPGHESAKVPKGFKANSMSWLSDQQGWVLGAGRCDGSPCARVIGTTDGGSHWRLVGDLGTRIIKTGRPRAGVVNVRFGTDQLGWAFGSQLWMTADGGASWSQQTIPGEGNQVLDLAAGPRATYAVVSPCEYGQGVCGKRLTLWRSPNSAPGTWRHIKLNLPSNFAAAVSIHGNSVYVIDDQLLFGHDGLFYGSTDGRHFSELTSPCDHSQDLALVQAVAPSTKDVDVLCDGDPGFSKAVKTVYRSTDNGATFTYAGQMGLIGIQAQLAVSPSGNLAVASWSDGSFIYTNDGGGTDWEMPVGLGDGGAGWNDITYVNDKTAWVVYAPVDAYPATGILYVTHDSGNTWSPYSFSRRQPQSRSTVSPTTLSRRDGATGS